MRPLRRLASWHAGPPRPRARPAPHVDGSRGRRARDGTAHHVRPTRLRRTPSGASSVASGVQQQSRSQWRSCSWSREGPVRWVRRAPRKHRGLSTSPAIQQQRSPRRAIRTAPIAWGPPAPHLVYKYAGGRARPARALARFRGRGSDGGERIGGPRPARRHLPPPPPSTSSSTTTLGSPAEFGLGGKKQGEEISSSCSSRLASPARYHPKGGSALACSASPRRRPPAGGSCCSAAGRRDPPPPAAPDISPVRRRRRPGRENRRRLRESEKQQGNGDSPYFHNKILFYQTSHSGFVHSASRFSFSSMHFFLKKKTLEWLISALAVT